jgi:hypothetical protein
VNTEKLELITEELSKSNTLKTARDYLQELPQEQYVDFLQQIAECIELQITITPILLSRISKVIDETVYFECDYAVLCAD